MKKINIRLDDETLKRINIEIARLSIDELGKMRISYQNFFMRCINEYLEKRS